MTAPGSFKRDDCRLCGGRDLELVVPMPPTAIADAYVPAELCGRPQPVYPLDLYFCRACSHVQLRDVVDPRLMFKEDYTYRSGSSGGIVEHFRKYADAVLAREKPAPGSLVVDVGSNDGTLLGFFKAGGMKVLGVDPAAELARAAAAAGVETLNGFFGVDVARRILGERGAARIVTANNVFAHADDMAGMAEGVRALLSPDGVFVCEFSYVVDIVDKMLLGTIFHEHVSYHAVKPLAGFLARHGLELVDVESVGIQGGSLICTAQPAGGPRRATPRVAEAIQREERWGVDDAETYRAFGGRIDRVKRDLDALLEPAAALGATLAGYGAARGGTTLLYRLDLGRRLGFIVDDSPAKQGLFSPGHHIPILPPDALYEKKPDYLVILAWVHAKAIMKSRQRYLDQGGRFVLCHPRVEAVAAKGQAHAS